LQWRGADCRRHLSVDAPQGHLPAPMPSALALQRHGGFRSDIAGTLGLGMRHGGYCIGCCWVLMALLFVGGVMNVLWIAAIAMLVLVEKIVPAGRLISRTAGAVFFAGGAWLIAQSL